MVQALRAILDHAAGMYVGAVVATADAALAEYPRVAYDLVVTDLQLARRGSGLDLVIRLRGAHPGAKVCVYSAFADPPLVRTLLEAGAAGYVRKTASVSEFVECLNAVVDDQQAVMDRETARDMVLSLRHPAAGGYTGPPLTPRELEILAEIITGAKTDTIGRRLGIAGRTVQNHIEHIYAKTGAQSRSHLVHLAHELEMSTCGAFDMPWLTGTG